MNSYYSTEELKEIGLGSYGDNVIISRKASIYGASNIHLGNNVRIDDFCILSGNIVLGNNIHIAAYSALYGGKDGIVMEDFSGLSSRISVYSASDDYSGETMSNPTVPEKYKKTVVGKVTIKRHALIGANCIILPGVTIEEGCSIGAMSLISRSTEPWSMYVGAPAKRIKERSRKLLELEKEYLLERENKGE